MAAAHKQSREARRIRVPRAGSELRRGLGAMGAIGGNGGAIGGAAARVRRCGAHPILPASRLSGAAADQPCANARDRRREDGPELTRRDRRGWGAALALAGAIFAVLLALASRTTLWDRDEPRFAQATVEMVASGDYLVPTFNGRMRPDKPILAYWWMSLPVRLLGPSAAAARLGSAAAMAIAALLTFAAGRRLLPERAGLWAMAVLAATPLAVVEGHAATADALLLAAVTGALACFAAALAGDCRSPWPWPWLGLGVALGLAQLAKEPVRVGVPGMGIATTLLILKRRARAHGAGMQGDTGGGE